MLSTVLSVSKSMSGVTSILSIRHFLKIYDYSHPADRSWNAKTEIIFLTPDPFSLSIIENIWLLFEWDRLHLVKKKVT